MNTELEKRDKTGVRSATVESSKQRTGYSPMGYIRIGMMQLALCSRNPRS